MARLNQMTDQQLEVEAAQLDLDLACLDQAPTDVPLPDEWFIAVASVEERANQIRWELKARHPERRIVALT